MENTVNNTTDTMGHRAEADIVKSHVVKFDEEREAQVVQMNTEGRLSCSCNKWKREREACNHIRFWLANHRWTGFNHTKPYSMSNLAPSDKKGEKCEQHAGVAKTICKPSVSAQRNDCPLQAMRDRGRYI